MRKAGCDSDGSRRQEARVAPGRLTYTEREMRKLLFRIRFYLAMWRMSRRFGPYGKPPF